jgi:hypothetical protein
LTKLSHISNLNTDSYLFKKGYYMPKRPAESEGFSTPALLLLSLAVVVASFGAFVYTAKSGSTFQPSAAQKTPQQTCTELVAKVSSAVSGRQAFYTRYDQQRASINQKIAQKKAQGYNTTQFEATLREIDQLVAKLKTDLNTLSVKWVAQKATIDCTNITTAEQATLSAFEKDLGSIQTEVNVIKTKVVSLLQLVVKAVPAAK